MTGQNRAAISVVIPAYNEAKRLPKFLASVRSYLDGRYGEDYELIVVDDGSDDHQTDVLAPLTADWPQLTTVRHVDNLGKGAAVRAGMLAAGGRRLLFADADGATPIEEEAKLAAAMDDGAEVAVGSRLAVDPGVRRRRTPVRACLGRAFARLARWWLGSPVRDTQCGFKMFDREAGRRLFSASEETGYLFDLELLALADRFGYRIVEVPVNWSDVPGGHLSLTREWRNVLVGLWRLRRRLRRQARSEGDPTP